SSRSREDRIESHLDHHRLNNLAVEFYSGRLARQLSTPSIFSLWTNRRALPTGVPPDILANGSVQISTARSLGRGLFRLLSKKDCTK
ncbi:MAG: hypothetical protein ABIB04_04025, partial [Patescibacteria group bacterium]